jgi:hypothetical protein
LHHTLSLLYVSFVVLLRFPCFVSSTANLLHIGVLYPLIEPM